MLILGSLCAVNNILFMLSTERKLTCRNQAQKKTKQKTTYNCSGDNDVESGKGRIYFNNRKEDIMFTRLRIGYSGLNKSLFTLGKHQSGGLCETCSEAETIDH